ncbi:sugar porter family MFS transporter [Brachybacterium sp. NBEC-018]|uniref:sugar porter family MFS transporter n=1 Tax=Brachybacterium sp. NBEC-018 TaxID=2996004 RepID=UPI002175260D|nr:sugar porter family MFS transporter [Brachybacterium sp. NBEC-018]UVY84411.1 sugar porter family MFS transporter [Brachybacterium sp. NBEC-018]
MTRSPRAPLASPSREGAPAVPRAARRRALGVALAASISGLMFGWDAMALNVVKNALVFHTGASAGMLGFAIAFGVLSAVLGAFLAGRLSDRVGRRAIMVIAALLFIVSSVGTAFVGGSILAFLFWRLFSGMAMGAAMTIAPAYVAETSPASMRGMLVSLRQFMLIVGLFVCGLLGDAMLAAAPAPEGDAPLSTSVLSFLGLDLEVWQWAFLSVALGGLIYLVASVTTPESPRFLIARGRLEEARAVLVRTVGEDGVDERVEEIARSLGDQGGGGFRSLLTPAGTNLQRIVWIGIGLAALQQLVGINAAFYYATTIFSTLGFGEEDALQQTLVLTAVKILAIVVGMLLVDRVGRRPLLLWGSVSMFAALVVTAIVMLTAPQVAQDGGGLAPDLASSPVRGVLALVALCLYVFAYAGTWGPIMWVLIGEMFPNRLRGAATSVAGGVEWASNFAVTLTFPVLAAWSIGATYILYAVVALVSVGFVLVAVPETKNVELEQMDELVGIRTR